MTTWREIVQRLAYLRRRDQFDRELNEEIQFHIDMRAEDLERVGLTREAALQQAYREFGSRARVGEETRSAWQFGWLEDLVRDLRYGARMLGRSPGFTTVAILSLGIGVAATSVMFTVVNGLLLQPPAIPRSNEVVALVSTARDSGGVAVSYPDYAAVRDRNQSFQGIAAFAAISTGLAPRRGAEPHVRSAKLVTANFFSLIGASPELGRTFPADMGKGARPEADTAVAILSHACWRTDFGADPKVVGTDAQINGVAFTIVGVMPAQFTDVDDDLSDDAPDFYVPLGAAKRLGTMPDLLANRNERVLVAFARLTPGVPIGRARADVATIAGALAQVYPETNRDRSLAVRSILEYRSGGGGIAASTLAMGLAGMVLLVACANVAGLLTSRASARAREIAVRLAIGAGRPRLVRQLLTESLLLAAGGGLVGIVIGYIPVVFGKRLVIEFDPQMVRFYPFVVNTRVLAFNVAIAVSSVVLFGLAPAFRATRTDLVSVIKGATGSPRRRRLLARWFGGRQWLVAGQVAIALLLLTATTVVYAGAYKDLIRSFRNPGFEVAHLLAVDFDPTTVHYKGTRATAFFNNIATRLRSTNGVRAAAVEYQDVALIRPDSPIARDDVRTSGVWIDDGFFDTLGIPIVEGRGIGRRDLDRAPTVAVVNDVLAHHYWPGQSAVGKQIHLHTGEWVTVVGVARLKAFMAFGTPPMDTIFVPYGAPADRVVRLLVRSTGDPQTLVEPIHAIVRDLDPDQAIPDATPWQTSLRVFVDATLLGLDTLGAMGGLGLVLALVGLYGLIAYDVSSRTREFGIRMALGARAATVVRMVLRQGLAVAACGIGAGLILTWLTVAIWNAFFAGSGLSATSSPDPNGGSQISFQIGTDSFGGHTFTALVIAVLIVTTLAAYLPARRVLRVDPNVALRIE